MWPTTNWPKPLAARLTISKTAAVELALRNELQHLDVATLLRERLRPIQDRVLTPPATGLQMALLCW
ncbi:MAG: hypothetical protein ACJ8AW_21700 [Rhodopila sp.]